jgi:deoxyribodipyrimidine photo-lyase
MNYKYSVGIHWFRRDLRISDHPSFRQASIDCNYVVPLYVTSNWSKNHRWTGEKRQTFLANCIDSLSKNISHIGGKLIIRHSNAFEELKKIILETKAEVLYFNLDPDIFGKQIDQQVIELAKILGIDVHTSQDCSLHLPTDVLTKEDKPYRVYTPFSKNWLALPKPNVVGKIDSIKTPANIFSEDLPTIKHWKLEKTDHKMIQAGEKSAHERFDNALTNRIPDYEDKRNFPSLGYTSRISADLRFGTISIRKIYHKVKLAHDQAPLTHQAGYHTYLKELAWREFYFSIIHFFPHVLKHEFDQQWRGLPWVEPDTKLEAWKYGQTGFPIVDAGMRELLATGFMHNRVRMITAMFLTKDLHYDWRIGESWFMQNLIDGEIASNNGGWQWSAGTGADAAPYFRIQNPWSQTARYDPQGIYIKRWIPELENVAPEKFLAPTKDNKPLAKGYPLPILNHDQERLRTMAIFKNHKAIGK